MTQGHGQQCGMAAGLGAGMDGGGLRGEYWDNCNRVTKNDKVRK